MDERQEQLKEFIREFNELQKKYNVEIVSDDPFCPTCIKDKELKKHFDFDLDEC